jgi:hypothetical protein
MAYELGQHHRKGAIDWEQMPFETVRSPEFGLRVPLRSINVSEVCVDEVRTVGSHSLFLTRVIRKSAVDDRSAALQLFHVHGSLLKFAACVAQGLVIAE